MTASGLARIVPVICAIVAAEFACAQNFPTTSIRIVTSPPGGSSDFAARLIAPGLSTGFNQTVIVDNRGGGPVPIEIVAKAPADGYTLLYYGSGLWINPLLQDHGSDDRLRDVMPVSIVVSSPNIVTVNQATYDPAGIFGFGPLSFESKRDGGYAQIAYRPTQVEADFLRNFEFVFRWDHLSRAPSGLGDPEEQRWTLGLDYWLGPATVLKAAFEWDQPRGRPNTNALLFQAAAGF